MKRIFYIFNLQAGKGALSTKIGQLLDLMTREGFEVTVHPTQAAFDAAHAAAEAADTGRYDYIFCSGGDGTLNEVMCGMHHAANKLPIGYIPCGSTNDFARSIGIPKGILKAAESVLKGIPRSFDMGMAGERSFNYIAAFGAFTDVTYETSQTAKNVLGPAAYILNSLTKLSNLRSFPMRITCDGRIYEDQFIFGMVTNAASVGGVLNIKDFRFDDGMFEVTLIRQPESAADLQRTIRFLADIHQMDEIDEDKNIHCFRASDITIELLEETDVPWTVDGEYMQNCDRLHIRNHRKAVTLLVPEQCVEHFFSETTA